MDQQANDTGWDTKIPRGVSLDSFPSTFPPPYWSISGLSILESQKTPENLSFFCFNLSLVACPHVSLLLTWRARGDLLSAIQNRNAIELADMDELIEMTIRILPTFDALDNCLETISQVKDSYILARTCHGEEPSQDMAAELDGTARLAIESINRLRDIAIGPTRRILEVRGEADPWRRIHMLLQRLYSALRDRSTFAVPRDRVNRANLTFYLNFNRKIISAIHRVERLVKELEDEVL